MMRAATAVASDAVPKPARSGFLAWMGRGLLLAVIPLSVVWVPVVRLPGLGNVSASDSVLLALWVVTGAALVMGGWFVIGHRPVLLILLALAIGTLAAFGAEFAAVGPGKARLEFMHFMKKFGLASILPLATTLFRAPGMGAWTRLLSTLAIAGIAVFTIFPELQYVLPRPEGWDADALQGRATGALTNPNDLAYAAVALAALHAALVPGTAGVTSRLLQLATVGGAAMCVITSGSRSGVLGAAAALLFLLVSRRVSLGKKFAAAAACALAIGVGLWSSTVFQDRLASAYRHGLTERNVYSRLEAQGLALRASLSHPLGVGYTGFARASAEERAEFTLVTSDSVYLDTLLASGFLGLLCLLALFATAWRHLGSARTANDSGARVLRAGMLAFLVFGAATVVPVSVFLSPLFFYVVSAGSYFNANGK
jgi:hypothetical protein